MGLRVNTNISAMQAHQKLNQVSKDTEDSMAKLSSGERINKAADDASGLAISEKMKAEIRSSRQASRNATDGLSLVQTAEGGLSETSNLLTRMRELAIQSASDTVSDSDRGKASIEYEALKNELERLSQVTEFNGIKLLNGSSGKKLDFQVGLGRNGAEVLSYDSTQLDTRVQALGVSSTGIQTKFNARAGLEAIDSAISKISSHRSVLGSLQNRLTVSSNNLAVYSENLSASNSRIRDVDYAEESANLARNQIIGNASTAIMAQANTTGQNASKLLK
ncbi:MAG: flagellin [Bacteriovoracaceae bacterium]